MQRGAAAAGRDRSGAELQLGAATTGRGHSGAEMQLGAAAAERRCSGVSLQWGGDAAGRGCCCGARLAAAFPQPPTAPSLFLQLCAARGTERLREASLIPHFILSPSSSHTSSPRPPQTTVPLSSPQPTSSSLYGPSKSPHPPISPFPSSATSSSFPLSLALFLSRLPFPLAPLFSFSHSSFPSLPLSL